MVTIGIVEARLRPALPAGEEFHQPLQRAERAGRLGQLRIAGADGGDGGFVAVGHDGQQLDDVGIGGVQRGHGAVRQAVVGRRDLLPNTGRKSN